MCSSVGSLQFQTLVHPLNYSSEPVAFHYEMPVTRLSALPDRPDLAIVAGTGQLVAHLSHLIDWDHTEVMPMTCSGGARGPTIMGETQPCVQAAAFKTGTRTTYVSPVLLHTHAPNGGLLYTDNSHTLRGAHEGTPF